MVFTLRQLQEKCREQERPLYLAFIDLTKAFDTVSRQSLYLTLKSIGCPPKLLNVITSFHEEMSACIQFDGNTSERFEIKSGVKQGCVLAPTLFGIYFAALLHHAFENTTEGIYIRTRLDGSLFNVSRLRAKTKTTEILLRELLFADDAAIAAHENHHLQTLMDKLSHACDLYSLTISVKKTEVMGQGTPSPPNIHLNGNELKPVDKFTYLGSTITTSISLDEEINSRIGKAATTFGKLTKRAWNNKQLTLRTKILIYQACVISVLLYGCETWSTYARQEKRLNSFHLRCLRKIMNIKWQEKVTNYEVLKRAGIRSMFTVIRTRRLRWIGHLRRMNNNRIPKQIFYGELKMGKRPRGRPKLRYKDVCRKSLKEFEIEEGRWEEAAENRKKWRRLVSKGAQTYEKSTLDKLEDDRQKRKERAALGPTAQGLSCQGCGRLCGSRIGRISHERSCSHRTG